MRVSDMENFVEQVAEDAYEKACEAVSDTVAEQTRAEDIEELRRYKKWLTSDERKTPKDKRDFVGRCLDNLENRLRGMAQKVMETLQNPRIKEQKKSEVRKWKTEYAPKCMDEEWHPCLVEALQNISKVEYQLDTLLEKDIPDRASVVSDIGKGVKSIAGRIEEYRRSQGDAGEHRKGRSQENSR